MVQMNFSRGTRGGDVVDRLVLAENRVVQLEHAYNELAAEAENMASIVHALAESHPVDQTGGCVLCPGEVVEGWGYHELTCPWSRSVVWSKQNDEEAAVRVRVRWHKDKFFTQPLRYGWPPRQVRLPHFEGEAQFIREGDPIETAAPLQYRSFVLAGIDARGLFVYEEEA